MPTLRAISVCVLLAGAGAGAGELLCAAPQSDGNGRGGRASARPAPAKLKAQPALAPLARFTVEPPDVLLVEVLEALPGRPISGERLVRPDGTISLGFYGDVNVAGLTVPEVKAKVILHLRPYLGDELLGLVKAQRDRAKDRDGKSLTMDPRDSDRVLVDITQSKSKFYYLQGAFAVPGRVPITGRDTVLDAVNTANGLMPDADHNQAYLYRADGEGSQVRALKINIDDVMLGDDLSTNYQLLPGDRVVVRRRAETAWVSDGVEAPVGAAVNPESSRPEREINRTRSSDDHPAAEGNRDLTESMRRLDTRLDALERKLNMILDALKSPRR